MILSGGTVEEKGSEKKGSGTFCARYHISCIAYATVNNVAIFAEHVDRKLMFAAVDQTEPDRCAFVAGVLRQ